MSETTVTANCSSPPKKYTRDTYIQNRTGNLNDITEKYNEITQKLSGVDKKSPEFKKINNQISELYGKLSKNNLDTMELLISQKDNIDKLSNTTDKVNARLKKFQEKIVFNQDKHKSNLKALEESVNSSKKFNTKFITLLAVVIVLLIVHIVILIFIPEDVVDIPKGAKVNTPAPVTTNAPVLSNTGPSNNPK